MNRACHQFRDRLAVVLGGPSSEPAEALRTLAWHEHLTTCHDCRAVLEAEEALDDLLASLPRPRLPAGVAARVLERLALERLLETAGPAPAPAGLAVRILAGLETARADAALDRLLALPPAPAASPGLAARTLAALAPHREGAPLQRSTPARRRRAPVPFPLGLRLAAAVTLLVGGALVLRSLREPGASRDNDEVASATHPPISPTDAPPAELLESLDLFESWDLITDDSIDVVLNSLDTADEVLLEIDQGSDPLEPLPEEPSKG